MSKSESLLWDLHSEKMYNGKEYDEPIKLT